MDTAYQLDSADRIVAVDAAWIAFAEANDAPTLPGRVLGHEVWRFISNPTVRELYRSLFHRIRATHTPVTLPFRCDSPTVRRFMMLVIGPGEGPAGSLSCRSTLIREEPQPPSVQALPESAWISAEADWTTVTRDALLTVCSWCKRLDVDGWREIDDAIAVRPLLFTEPVRRLTHGLCPTCGDALRASFP